MIEIDAIEHGLQCADIAVEKLGAGKKIEGRHAIRREAILHETVKFLRHQMKRNVAAGEGIDQDDVVSFFVAIQEHAAVTLDQAHLARFANSEIFLGNVDHAGVELDAVDRRIRKKTAKIGRDPTGAQTDDQHTFHVLRIDRRNAHGAGIQHRQIVGVGQVHLRLLEVVTLPMKRHREQVLGLGDEDVIVDGLDARDQTVFPFEHGGANFGIEHLFGSSGRDRP